MRLWWGFGRVVQGHHSCHYVALSVFTSLQVHRRRECLYIAASATAVGSVITPLAVH